MNVELHKSGKYCYTHYAKEIAYLWTVGILQLRKIGWQSVFGVAHQISVLVQQDSIVDTTGAGDAFIGATLYGLLKGLSISKTLELASVSAACKCTALGARAGQPTRDEFKSDLLE